MRKGRSEAKAWLKTQQDFRKAQLEKYARHRNGRLLFCVPPKEVRDQRRAEHKPPLKQKIIFDSANICQDYLDAIGDTHSRIYTCPFSKHGHVHFTRV